MMFLIRRGQPTPRYLCVETGDHSPELQTLKAGIALVKLRASQRLIEGRIQKLGARFPFYGVL